MKLVLDEDKKKVYVEEGEIDRYYSMIDMGEYIGHSQRDWYETAPSNWFLMFYDEKDKNSQTLFHAEALVDQYGEYQRLILEEKGYKRVMQLQGDYIMSDIVYDNRNESFDGAWVGKSYIGYEHDDNTKPLPRLSTYLLGDKEFKSEDGIILSEKPNDYRVTEFLLNNDNISLEFKDVK